MFSYDANTFFLTRGDTARFNVTLTRDNGRTAYELMELDRVVFTIKAQYTDTEFVVQKQGVIDDDNKNVVHFSLDPEDTEGLDFGVYDYDIELTLANGDVCTVVVGTFELTKEVTW